MKYQFLVLFAIAAIILAGCARQEPASTASPAAAGAKTDATAPAASGGVDVAAINLTASSPSYSPADRVSFYPVVQNLGDAVTGVDVGLYIDNKLIHTFTFDFKKSGEMKSGLFTWYPEKEGSYSAKIAVDPDSRLNDKNPANNQFSTNIQIG